MKKKVGILTLPLSNNYGGIIQAAALYHFLESNGFDPILINRRLNLSPIRVLLRGFFENNPFHKIYDPNNLYKRKIQDALLLDFINIFFKNRTKKLFNNRSLENATSKINAFVVGSDQVWRYAYTRDIYKNFFLDFVKDSRKRISYAASFGIDRWEGDALSKNNIGELLKSFDFISIREKHGVEYLLSEFNITSQNTLDPTFLVNVEFYKNLMEFSSTTKAGGIFNYVLDQDQQKQTFVNSIGSYLKLDINQINLTPSIKEIKPSIQTWLKHIYEADYVVTDSFHGMVFSIIFNKQFLVLINKKRGAARFESLLGQLGLMKQMLDQPIDLTNYSVESIVNNKQIDYVEVNNKLDELRHMSKKFLLDSLK